MKKEERLKKDRDSREREKKKEVGSRKKKEEREKERRKTKEERRKGKKRKGGKERRNCCIRLVGRATAVVLRMGERLEVRAFSAAAKCQSYSNSRFSFSCAVGWK